MLTLLYGSYFFLNKCLAQLLKFWVTKTTRKWILNYRGIHETYEVNQLLKPKPKIPPSLCGEWFEHLLPGNHKYNCHLYYHYCYYYNNHPYYHHCCHHSHLVIIITISDIIIIIIVYSSPGISSGVASEIY